MASQLTSVSILRQLGVGEDGTSPFQDHKPSVPANLPLPPSFPLCIGSPTRLPPASLLPEEILPSYPSAFSPGRVPALYGRMRDIPVTGTVGCSSRRVY